MQDLPSILSLFHREINNFNNTGAQMIMTFKGTFIFVFLFDLIL